MPDCDHCGLDLGGEPVVDAGAEGKFCCRGCLGVSGLVAEIDADVPARRTGDPDVPVGEFERDGRTVSGVVADVGVTVGHPDELAGDAWTVPDRLREAVDEAFEDDELPSLVGWGGAVRGVITVRDEPREGWTDVVSEPAADGREIVFLTGDDERTVRRFADETNDAPALAAADLGVAFGSGTDLAIDAADVVVVDDDLSAVPTLFDIARRTRQRIRSNLLWAAGYNAVAIPLAAFGFINPVLAALLMALSSLFVVANSARTTTLTNWRSTA